MAGKRVLNYLFFLSLVLIPGCSPSIAPQSNLLVITGNTMGTTFTVKVVKNNFLLLGDTATRVKELEESINGLLADINKKMSTWDPDSEISVFNRSPEDKWVPVSAETASVISAAGKISGLTGGAFDITIGPLINLWGFGPRRKPVKIPLKEDIHTTRKITGYTRIFVQNSPPALKKEVKGMVCNLSGIAKGYGVDAVASLLNSRGFYNYMVEVGGEISVRGKNGKGVDWKLGILSPDGSNAIKKVISIGDRAMATSGDYHNYFEEEGIRYSHIIDPATGKPIAHKLVSVTVVMDTCMEADALATGITVLGPEKGLALAQENGIPVYMIVKENDGYAERMSTDFKSFSVDSREK